MRDHQTSKFNWISTSKPNSYVYFLIQFFLKNSIIFRRTPHCETVSISFDYTVELS